MKTDWQVLTALKTYTLAHIGDYYSEQTECGSELLYTLASKNIVIDEPDFDNMADKVMFYIVPNFAQNESLSMGSDQYSLSCDVYIVCKGKTKENLVKQVHGFKACFEHMIGENPTLGNEIDFSAISDAKFYPGIENIGCAKAYQLTLEMQWQKTY